MDIEKEIAKLKEIMSENEPAPEIPKFNIAAANLALSYISIRKCWHCGGPVVRGYCCPSTRCPDASNPDGGDRKDAYNKAADKYFEFINKRDKQRKLDTELNLGSGI